MAGRKELETRKKTYAACCDIYKDNSKVILDMEMPGVMKDNLKIEVDEDQLIISGKKILNQPGGKYKIREINDGDYYNVFTLDDTIDRNKIDASINNGVVKLSLGIKESEKPRKITVKAK